MADIDVRLSRRLQAIAEELDAIIEREIGERCAFGLVVQPYSIPGRPESPNVQYISNHSDRAYMATALRKLLERWEARLPAVPYHRRQ